MHPLLKQQKAPNNFLNARSRARLNKVLRRLRRQPCVLLPFEDLYPRLTIRGQHDRGYRTVPLAQIVGSEGRHRDFDRDWMPHSDQLMDRWQSIDRAHARGCVLPPVELCQLSDVYFVRDGHHRISVARQRGQLAIEARVIELVIDIPLTVRLTVTDLDRVEEQNDFFTWTELARLRPESAVEVSNLGGYLDLVACINRHRAQLRAVSNREISRDEAIADWYDAAYLPLVQLIREHGLLAVFPNRTEADLYIGVAQHRHASSEQHGRAVSLDEALNDYARRYAPRALRGWLMQRAAGFRLVLGARMMVRRLIEPRQRG